MESYRNPVIRTLVDQQGLSSVPARSSALGVIEGRAVFDHEVQKVVSTSAKLEQKTALKKKYVLGKKWQNEGLWTG